MPICLIAEGGEGVEAGPALDAQWIETPTDPMLRLEVGRGAMGLRRCKGLKWRLEALPWLIAIVDRRWLMGLRRWRSNGQVGVKRLQSRATNLEAMEQ